MNDNSAHMSNDPGVSSDVSQAQPNQNQQPNNSYVDDYQPPAGNSVPPASEPGISSTPAPAAPVVAEAPDLVPTEIPVSAPAQPESDSPNPTSTSSETLEDQNIFTMLGVEDGTEELKENFLNELQDVIWDDFLKNDVNLLITSDEKVKFDEIMAKKDSAGGETMGQATAEAKKNDDKIQDALVAYLETLIPDLEDIMLEKALDLKADLFAERIIGMREYHANSPENLKLVNDADKMMKEDKWHSAAKVLNGIDTKS